MNLREVINQITGLELLSLIRVTINTSGTPGIIRAIDKKINVVKIMTYNIQIKITIIP
jgi:hypothetical protein